MTSDKILKYGIVISVGVIIVALYTQYRLGKRKDDKFSVKTEGKIIKK